MKLHPSSTEKKTPFSAVKTLGRPLHSVEIGDKTHSDWRNELHGDATAAVSVAVGVARRRSCRDLHEAVPGGASGGGGCGSGGRRVGSVIEAGEEAPEGGIALVTRIGLTAASAAADRLFSACASPTVVG